MRGSHAQRAPGSKGPSLRTPWSHFSAEESNLTFREYLPHSVTVPLTRHFPFTLMNLPPGLRALFLFKDRKPLAYSME